MYKEYKAKPLKHNINTKNIVKAVIKAAFFLF